MPVRPMYVYFTVCLLELGRFIRLRYPDSLGRFLAYFTRIFKLLNKFNSLKNVSISSYEKSAGSAFETIKHIKSLARQSLLKMIDFCTRARHRLFPTPTLDFD
jgi:hypothetical protein